MSSADFLSNAAPEVLEKLEARYRTDPESLDPTWRAFFAGLELGRDLDGRGSTAITGAVAAGVTHARSDADKPPATSVGATPLAARAIGLVHGYRDLGHLIANLNPLSPPDEWHPLLDIEHFSLNETDLSGPSEGSGFHGEPPATVGDLLNALRETYCGTLGVEFTHIRDSEQREWLAEQMEPTRNRPQIDSAMRRLIYTKLVEAESFEQFLHKKYPGQKRFSLEGGETLIPLLEVLVEECAQQAIEQLVLGMAHRGRLNVLANFVRKPYEMILAEFEGSTLPDWVQGDGDVKYHQGYSRDHHASGGRVVHVSLTPNPSHLELVNPIVEGKVRGKQNTLGDRERNRVLPLLVHGDASFVGQGVVPETLLLAHLRGYFTGGTIHVVLNNQVGFTTPPDSARPMRYATDIARIIESPVFHVNADDPEMAVHAIRMALRFRQRFKRDAVVDLICYRRFGHNELDDPTFTQPTMYRAIAAHETTRAIYEKKLRETLEIPGKDLDSIQREASEILDLALQYARDFRPRQQVFSFGDTWKSLGPPGTDRSASTAVAAAVLTDIAKRAATLPDGFAVHPKIDKLYQTRLEAVQRGTGIDWGCAEMLAIGALLREGTPVRLTGQDTGRGTFSHRHSVLHDQESDARYVPLNAITVDGEPQALLEVLDSPLSEEAALAFEYGYSWAAPDTLTAWEAQFGDFANGAQAVIDTYISAAESKWQRASGLVLLLPHGYEGQGPEHSSARLERFLQLCADDNMQVVVPTTAAQYFHVLRRQMRRPFRKPLVVMTPKSLLRFAPSSSALEELTDGAFEPVLADPVSNEPGAIRTLAMCSGKVFYDIARGRQDRPAPEVAIIRVEELYPFPAEPLKAVLARYPLARDVVWVQDEPSNMGAWSYVAPRLRELIGAERALRYAGRDEAASPATGSYQLHAKEQAALLNTLFEGAATERPPAQAKLSRLAGRAPARRAEAGAS